MNEFAKKLIVTLGILFSTTSVCSAADTTINVTGKVIASPCSTGTGASYTIDLGQAIPASSLQKWGDITPVISKNVVLSGCPAGTKTVTATFSGDPFPGSPTNFNNTGTAKNIGINVTDANNYTYVPGSTGTVNVAADGTATFPLKIRGASIGNATVGTIKSAVVMTFTYN